MSGLSFIFAALGSNLLYWSMIVEHLPELRNREHDPQRRRLPGPIQVAARWLYLWTRQLHAPTNEHRAELGYLNILAAMALVNLAITVRGLEHLWALIA